MVRDLPARALLDASQEAALLVVGARGSGGFGGLHLGSVSQHCLHHTSWAVVVMSLRHALQELAERFIQGEATRLGMDIPQPGHCLKPDLADEPARPRPATFAP